MPATYFFFDALERTSSWAIQDRAVSSLILGCVFMYFCAQR